MRDQLEEVATYNPHDDGIIFAKSWTPKPDKRLDDTWEERPSTLSKIGGGRMGGGLGLSNAAM